jgi:hypothetical protein
MTRNRLPDAIAVLKIAGSFTKRAKSPAAGARRRRAHPGGGALKCSFTAAA